MKLIQFAKVIFASITGIAMGLAYSVVFFVQAFATLGKMLFARLFSPAMLTDLETKAINLNEDLAGERPSNYIPNRTAKVDEDKGQRGGQQAVASLAE